ncbi:MAG: DoxX family protein [Cyanobacteria bacterium RM1_2_2]|nr:DoxX family protein [Cyanobacteria bacterium RM1_2_2]
MSFQKYLPLMGRTFIGLSFLYAGLNNLTNFGATQERIAGMLPFPGLALAGNILCCLIGAISLILGFKARWGAVILILFLIPTTLVFHPFWADSSQANAFLKNLALIGSLLYVYYTGAGAVSLDAKSARQNRTLVSDLDGEPMIRTRE